MPLDAITDQSELDLLAALEAKFPFKAGRKDDCAKANGVLTACRLVSPSNFSQLTLIKDVLATLLRRVKDNTTLTGRLRKKLRKFGIGAFRQEILKLGSQHAALARKDAALADKKLAGMLAKQLKLSSQAAIFWGVKEQECGRLPLQLARIKIDLGKADEALKAALDAAEDDASDLRLARQIYKDLTATREHVDTAMGDYITIRAHFANKRDRFAAMSARISARLAKKSTEDVGRFLKSLVS